MPFMGLVRLSILWSNKSIRKSITKFDSMLHELRRFGVKVDHSKPELMRSPFFDPFYGKNKKRKAAENYIKRGRKQADFARVTVYEWNEYDPDDLYIKPCDLNGICWDDETREAVTTQPTYSKDDIIQMPRMEIGYNPAGSTSLFDQLREACYPMYSKKKIWGYDFVLSLAKSLGDGQSERKITDTAKEVFEWIEREFLKSHDASKAHNGKGSMWANMRWCKERTKKQLLVDFATKEGFSRQHASKLSKTGKIYEQFGRYFYARNKVNDPTSYIKSFHLVVPSNQDDKEINSVITNKHVNQPLGHANVVNLFEDMNHQEVEKPPPRSSPNGLEVVDCKRTDAIVGVITGKPYVLPDYIEEALRQYGARR
jgi:hypothetical protein